MTFNLLLISFLLQCMKEHKVFNLVFSSSATVYGQSQYLPLDEKHPVGVGITNPYGQTKFFIEQIIRDLAATDKVRKMFQEKFSSQVGLTLHEYNLVCVCE